MEVKEELDDVVEEVPVFLSRSLSERLFIFQYPLCPANVSEDHRQIVGCRVKPLNQQVELKIDLDTQSPNYDKSRGRSFAENANKGDKQTFNDKQMNYMEYQSSKAVSDCCRYAVGKFQYGELHVTPVKGIVQLKPSFKYLDVSAQSETATEEDADEGVEEKITVKFARRETDKMKENREKSFAFLEKKKAEETWAAAKYYDCSEARSKLEQGKLLCIRPEDVTSFSMDNFEYLCSVVGHRPSATPTPSLLRFRSLPLPDQVREFMIQANVAQYSTLLDFLRPINSEKFLKSVQQVSLLVQGCWVVRSEELYSKEKKSKTNGVNSEFMTRGRDYVLLLFTKQRTVDRKTIMKVTKLPVEEVTEILEPIANFVPKCGWEFKLPSDSNFVKNSPEVVHRQQRLWEAKEQQLNQAFRSSEIIHPKIRRRSRSQRQSESFSSDNESGTETGRRRHNSLKGKQWNPEGS